MILRAGIWTGFGKAILLCHLVHRGGLGAFGCACGFLEGPGTALLTVRSPGRGVGGLGSTRLLARAWTCDLSWRESSGYTSYLEVQQSQEKDSVSFVCVCFIFIFVFYQYMCYFYVLVFLILIFFASDLTALDLVFPGHFKYSFFDFLPLFFTLKYKVGQSRFTIMSIWNTEFILALSFISYCIISQTNNCKPTFVPSCTCQRQIFSK